MTAEEVKKLTQEIFEHIVAARAAAIQLRDAPLSVPVYVSAFGANVESKVFQMLYTVRRLQDRLPEHHFRGEIPPNKKEPKN